MYTVNYFRNQKPETVSFDTYEEAQAFASSVWWLDPVIYPFQNPEEPARW